MPADGFPARSSNATQTARAGRWKTTARELDVDEGDVLIGSRTLNGWLWCHRLSQAPAEAGWVPLAHLQAAPD